MSRAKLKSQIVVPPEAKTTEWTSATPHVTLLQNEGLGTSSQLTKIC